ncbi:MAG: hypothetical protein AB1442_11135 [Nitrospirota bacterium]
MFVRYVHTVVFLAVLLVSGCVPRVCEAYNYYRSSTCTGGEAVEDTFRRVWGWVVCPSAGVEVDIVGFEGVDHITCMSPGEAHEFNSNALQWKGVDQIGISLFSSAPISSFEAFCQEDLGTHSTAKTVVYVLGMAIAFVAAGLVVKAVV